MRPTIRVVSTAVLLRSRRKAAQGMRAMAKDVALAQGSKDVAPAVPLSFEHCRLRICSGDIILASRNIRLKKRI